MQSLSLANVTELFLKTDILKVMKVIILAESIYVKIPFMSFLKTGIFNEYFFPQMIDLDEITFVNSLNCLLPAESDREAIIGRF